MNPPERSILIIGCGAIGGLFAAYLDPVAKVTVFDVDPAWMERVRSEGLRITGRTQKRVRPRAVSDPDELRGDRFDAMIFLVKSQHTAAAAGTVLAAVSEPSLLVTFQNGMGNAEALAQSCAWPVAHGMTLEAARLHPDGSIEHLIHGPSSWLGPVRGSLEGVQWLGELLDRSGIPTRTVADPRGAIWSKFIFNAVMNPIGALVGGVNAARYQSPEVCAVIDAMADECRQLARAKGITLSSDPLEMVKKTRSGELPITRHAGSMALDLEAGRETEIESLTGYVVREALALGIQVPVTQTVYRLLKGLELATRIRNSPGA